MPRKGNLLYIRSSSYIYIISCFLKCPAVSYSEPHSVGHFIFSRASLIQFCPECLFIFLIAILFRQPYSYSPRQWSSLQTWKGQGCFYLEALLLCHYRSTGTAQGSRWRQCREIESVYLVGSHFCSRLCTK